MPQLKQKPISSQLDSDLQKAATDLYRELNTNTIISGLRSKKVVEVRKEMAIDICVQHAVSILDEYPDLKSDLPQIILELGKKLQKRQEKHSIRNYKDMRLSQVIQELCQFAAQEVSNSHEKAFIKQVYKSGFFEGMEGIDPIDLMLKNSDINYSNDEQPENFRFTR